MVVYRLTRADARARGLSRRYVERVAFAPAHHTTVESTEGVSQNLSPR